MVGNLKLRPMAKTAFGSVWPVSGSGRGMLLAFRLNERNALCYEGRTNKGPITKVESVATTAATGTTATTTTLCAVS